MFRKKKDKGETRTFLSIEEYRVGSNGQLHREDTSADVYDELADFCHGLGDEFAASAESRNGKRHRADTSAEIYAAMSRLFHGLGDEFSELARLRRQAARSILEDEAFDAMVSGS